MRSFKSFRALLFGLLLAVGGYAQAGNIVESAWYGKNNPRDLYVDPVKLKATIQKAIDDVGNNDLNYKVNGLDSVFANPAPGNAKQLVVVLVNGSRFTAFDQETLTIPASEIAKARSLLLPSVGRPPVQSAYYGDPNRSKNRCYNADILRNKLNRLVLDAAGRPFSLNENLSVDLGDPAYGTKKILSVTLANGYTKEVWDGETFTLSAEEIAKARGLIVSTVAAGPYFNYTKYVSSIRSCWNPIIYTASSDQKNPIYYFAVAGEGAGCAKAYSFDGTSVMQIGSDILLGGIYSYAIAWSPNGKYLAFVGASSSKGAFQVYSFDGTKFTQVKGAYDGDAYTSVAWSPDGNYLALGKNSAGGKFNIYPTSLFITGNYTGGVTDTFVGNIRSMKWHPTGKFFAVAGDKGFRVYGFNGTLLAQLTFRAWTGTVYDVDWSPDGTFLAAAGSNPGSAEGTILADDTVRIYKFNPGVGGLTPVAGYNYGTECHSVSWNPADGKTLAVGGQGAANGGTNNSFTDTNLVRFYEFTGLALKSLVSYAVESPLNTIVGMWSCVWDKTGRYLNIVGETATFNQYYGILDTNFCTPIKSVVVTPSEIDQLTKVLSPQELDKSTIVAPAEIVPWRVSVGNKADGTTEAWMVDTAENLYRYYPASAMMQPYWAKQIVNIGATIINQGFVDVSVSSDGYLVALTTDGRLFLHNVDSSEWKDISINKSITTDNAITNVAIGSASTVFAVAQGNVLYKYDGTSWTYQSKSVTAIATSIDGTTYAINTSGNVFQFSASAGWTPVKSAENAPLLLTSIAVGGIGQAWGIYTDSTKNVADIWKYTTAAGWKKVEAKESTTEKPVYATGFRSISINAVGTVFAVAIDGTIYTLQGSTTPVAVLSKANSPKGFVTSKIAALTGVVPSKVSVGSKVNGTIEAWMIGTYTDTAGSAVQNLYRYYPASGTSLFASWVKQLVKNTAVTGSIIETGFVDVSVSSDGYVVVVDKDGKLFHYDVAKNIWTDISSGRFFSRASIGNSINNKPTIFAIEKTTNSIYQYDSTKTDKWVDRNGSGSCIAVGYDGTVYAISSGSVFNFVVNADGTFDWKPLVSADGSYLVLTSIAVGSKDYIWGINLSATGVAEIWQCVNGIWQKAKTGDATPKDATGFTSMSVNAAGTVFALDSNGTLYNFGSAGYVTQVATTTPVTTEVNLPSGFVMGGDFAQTAANAFVVSVGSDGQGAVEAWLIDDSGKLYRYDAEASTFGDDPWAGQLVTGSGVQTFDDVSVSSDGYVVAVDKEGKLFQCEVAKKIWTEISSGRTFSRASIGNKTTIFAIEKTTDAKIYRYDSTKTDINSRWVDTTGRNGISIAVGYDGTVYGIAKGGQVILYDVSKNSWIKVKSADGSLLKLTSIAVGSSNNIWGINVLTTGVAEIWQYSGGAWQKAKVGDKDATGLTSISVNAAGTVFAINKDKLLCTKGNLGYVVPGTVTTQVTVVDTGLNLPSGFVTTDGYASPLGIIPTKVSVGSTSDGIIEAWMIDSSKNLYRYDPSYEIPWVKQIVTTESKSVEIDFVDVSVSSDGYVLAAHTTGGLFLYDIANNSWTELKISGKIFDRVSIGNQSTLFAIDKSTNAIYQYDETNVTAPWTSRKATGSSIAVGNDGTVYRVVTTGEVYTLSFDANKNPIWTKVTYKDSFGKTRTLLLSTIACGNQNIAWGTRIKNQGVSEIWKCVDGVWQNATGDNGNNATGFKSLSVNAAGTVFGLDAQGAIYTYEGSATPVVGISKANIPSGFTTDNEFAQSVARATTISVGSDGKGAVEAWMIGDDTKLYRYDNYSMSDDPWTVCVVTLASTISTGTTKIDVGFVDVSVSSDGYVAVVTTDGKLFQYEVAKNIWTDISSGKTFSRVSIGNKSTIFAIDKNPDVSGEKVIYQYKASKWVDSKGRGECVAAGYDGTVYGITKGGQLHLLSVDAAGNYKWTPKPNDAAGKKLTLTQVAVSNKNTLWGIYTGTDNTKNVVADIWKYTTTNGWQRAKTLDGKDAKGFTSISVNAAGTVFAVDQNKILYTLGNLGYIVPGTILPSTKATTTTLKTTTASKTPLLTRTAAMKAGTLKVASGAAKTRAVKTLGTRKTAARTLNPALALKAAKLNAARTAANK